MDPSTIKTDGHYKEWCEQMMTQFNDKVKELEDLKKTTFSNHNGRGFFGSQTAGLMAWKAYRRESSKRKRAEAEMRHHLRNRLQDTVKYRKFIDENYEKSKKKEERLKRRIRDLENVNSTLASRAFNLRPRKKRKN